MATIKNDPAFAKFARNLARALDDVNERCGQLAAKLAMKFAATAEWDGDDIIKQGARARVFGSVSSWVANAPDVETSVLVAEVDENIVRSARYPKRSTSPSSNLFAQEEGAAWCEVRDMLRRAKVTA